MIITEKKKNLQGSSGSTPKAHQRLAYSISRVENVLRKRGRGDSEEVSESNEAIVPGADQTPTLPQPRLLATKALIDRPEL